MWHCGSEQNTMVVEECIVLHTLESTRDPDDLVRCDRLGSEPGIGWGCHQLPNKTNTMRSLSIPAATLVLGIRQPRAMFSSRGASAKFGSYAAVPSKPRRSAACAAQSLCGRRPSCFLPFISQLECGMMWSSSPGTAQSGDAFQDLTLHRVALGSFRSSSPHSSPALPLCLLHSCRTAWDLVRR